jgi:hypothetical protein
MRNTLLAAATAFVIGGATVGSLISYAQPAPPPGPGATGAMMDGGPHGPTMDGGSRGPMMDGGPRGPMHWGHRWHEGHEGREGHHLMTRGTFALVYRQADRNLSPADVQKVAEAFLLWHGNHTWKVVNVAAASDGAIGFSLATQEGSVIASFTMDPHTGRITRTG